MIYEWFIGLTTKLLWGANGIILGGVAWFVSGAIMVFLKVKHKITPVEKIGYPWKKAKRTMFHSLVGWGIVGLIIGVLVDVFSKPDNLLSRYNWPGIVNLLIWSLMGLVGGFIFGIFWGFCLGLLQMIDLNLPLEQLVERKTFSPNRGIRHSLRNGCLSFLWLLEYFADRDL